MWKRAECTRQREVITQHRTAGKGPLAAGARRQTTWDLIMDVMLANDFLHRATRCSLPKGF